MSGSPEELTLFSRGRGLHPILEAAGRLGLISRAKAARVQELASQSGTGVESVLLEHQLIEPEKLRALNVLLDLADIDEDAPEVERSSDAPGPDDATFTYMYGSGAAAPGLSTTRRQGEDLGPVDPTFAYTDPSAAGSTTAPLRVKGGESDMTTLDALRDKERHDILFSRFLVEEGLVGLEQVNGYLKEFSGKKGLLGFHLVEKEVFDESIYLRIEQRVQQALGEATRTGDTSAALGPFVILREEGHIELVDRRGMEQIGDYQVLSEIARGGMGIVFKARQAGLNRIVALKVLLSGEGASPDLVQRFVREALAASKLRHPHIVPIYEFGEHRGNPYFTMEYVKGKSLADKLASGELGGATAVNLMIKVCRAIHHAHEQGIVHRDIKPSNIMVDASSEPKVMDFGLAKEMDSDENLTRSGMAMGTPAYMPPEQAVGDRAAVDRRSDVYSLGAVLYQILGGQPPFSGPPMGIIMQVLHDDPQPLRKVRPGVNADLVTICEKAMAKEPGHRYQSAAALADDLTSFSEGRQIMARPASLTYRLRRWVGRHRALTVVAVCAIAVVLSQGYVLGSRYLAERSARESLQAENLRTLELRARALARALATEKRARIEARRRREVEQQLMARDRRKIEAYNRRAAARPHFDKAQAHDKNGEYVRALASYDRALAQDPGYEEAYLAKAILHKRRAEYPQALAVLDQLVERFRGSYNGRSERAAVYRLMARYPQALADCNLILARLPGDVETLLHRGRLFMLLGRPREALVDFDRLLAINQRLAEGHHNRGWALVAVDRKPEALEAFGRAVSHDPQFVPAHQARGILLMESQQLAAAEGALASAIGIQRKRYGVLLATRRTETLPQEIKRYKWNLLRRAVCRLGLGKIEQALADTRTLLPIDPQFAPGLYRQAQALAQLGDGKGALLTIENLRASLRLLQQRRALARHGLTGDDIELLACRVQLLLGRTGAALTALKGVKGRGPLVAYWRGRVYLAMGKGRRAEAYFHQGLETSDRWLRARLHLYFGRAVQSGGGHAEAARHYRKARLADPALRRAWVDEALALLRSGDRARASKVLERAMGAGKTSRLIRRGIDALLAGGFAAEAALLARRAWKKWPRRAWCRVAWARALYRQSALARHENESLLGKAIAALEGARAVSPRDHQLLYNLAGVLDRANRHKEALAAIDGALRLARGQARYHLLRAQVLFSDRKSYLEGLEALSAAIGLDPSYTDAYRLRARVYHQGYAFAQALRDTGILLRKDPHDLAALRIRAMTLYELKKYTEALDVWNRLLKLHPEPGVLINRAMTRYKMDDKRGARRDFQKFLREYPQHPRRAEIEKVARKIAEQLRGG